MNSLHAVITVCASVLLVLIAIGIQSLRLEYWGYDPHFDE